MKVPRDVNGSEAVRALKRLGFEVLRQNGSHVILRKRECTIVVPQHKPLKVGTLKGILDQAEVELDKFIENL